MSDYESLRYDEDLPLFAAAEVPTPRLARLPDHDGETYEATEDQQRLNTALGRTYAAMLDGRWHTLRELARKVETSEAGVSARIRDLRKPKFQECFPCQGVERERREGGLWVYRLVR